MGTTSLLDLDVRQILSKTQKLTSVKLPVRIIEISIVPTEDILYIRFKEPKEAEFGEPLHPKIHVYRDKDTDEVTALEIINPGEL